MVQKLMALVNAIKGNKKRIAFTISAMIGILLLYIMRNAGLEETQAGIKIARRNTNNLRYADDTTLMAETKKN